MKLAAVICPDNYCSVGLNSEDLEGMQRVWSGRWQREENVSNTIRMKVLTKFCLCLLLHVYFLESVKYYQTGIYFSKGRSCPRHRASALLVHWLRGNAFFFPCLFVASLNFLAHNFTCHTVDNCVSLSCPVFCDRHNLLKYCKLTHLSMNYGKLNH
jgi:hypothetical protein